MMRDQRPTSPWLRRGIVAALVALVLFLHLGWFTVVLHAPDPAEAAVRDWIQFHRTAERIVSGQADEVYPREFRNGTGPEFEDGFFFLYPPFAAVVTLPLAALSPWGAYLACYLGVLAVTVVATLLVLRGLAVPPGSRIYWLLWTMASAPWNIAVLMGHLSATLLLSPSLAFLGWLRRNPVGTGAALSLLLAKPNWGLPVLFFLVVGRQWRMVMGFGLGAAGLVLASLPLGLRLWPDWIQTMVNYWAIVTDGTPPWKQVTLYGSLQSLLGRTGADPWVQGPWMVLSAALMAGLTWAWIRAGPVTENLPRLLGVTLLAIAATNSYAYFYDGLLLVPAALHLWTQTGVYRTHGLRAGARVASLLTWGWMHLQFFFFAEAGLSLTGLGLSAWLTLELLDLLWSPDRHKEGDRTEMPRSTDTAVA